MDLSPYLQHRLYNQFQKFSIQFQFWGKQPVVQFFSKILFLIFRECQEVSSQLIRAPLSSKVNNKFWMFRKNCKISVCFQIYNQSPYTPKWCGWKCLASFIYWGKNDSNYNTAIFTNTVTYFCCGCGISPICILGGGAKNAKFGF